MGIARWYRSRRARQDGIRELAALGSGAGFRLRDVGVSRGQLAEILLHPGQRPLWLRMADAHGIDAGPILHDVDRIEGLASQCAACGVRRACRRWFAGANVDGSDVVRRCPNRAALAALPAQRGGRRGRGVSEHPRVDSPLRYLAPTQPGESP